jgi:hypothetical protein
MNENLNGLRYIHFVKSAATVKVILAPLPPTTEAAKYHAYRTYHQVQKWLGVKNKATDWGWEMTATGLVPITTDLEPAPQSLLRMISCKFKKGYAGGCSCRKAGLKFSALCRFFSGKSCQNAPPLQLKASDSEDDGHPVETMDLVSFPIVKSYYNYV